MNIEFEMMRKHVGHNVECVTYGKENVAIECEDCNEVIYDVDNDEESNEMSFHQEFEELLQEESASVADGVVFFGENDADFFGYREEDEQGIEFVTAVDLYNYLMANGYIDFREES